MVNLVMREQQGLQFQQDTPRHTNAINEIYTSFIKSRTVLAAKWSTKTWMRVRPAREEDEGGITAYRRWM